MFVSQSFKTKNADGSFGNEVKFSTISDLVFYGDNKSLTLKTNEIIQSISTVENNLNGKISTEKSGRESADAAIRQEMSDQKTALQNEIDEDILTAKGELQGAIENIESSVEGLNTLIVGNTNSINTINTTLTNLTGQVETVEGLVGTKDSPSEGTVFAMIATLQSNYTALLEEFAKLEERILALETPKTE